MADKLSNSLSDAITNLNTKVAPQTPSISPTYASHITSQELIIRKSGGMVVGHLIFAFDSSYSGGGGMGEIITNVGGLPKSAVAMQMPIVCVAGTNAGKVGRVRISTDGKLQFWYSNLAGSASETYLIPICYPTND